MAAGLDIEMPGPARYRKSENLEAICQGASGMKDIDTSFKSVLKFVKRAALKSVSKEEGFLDKSEDRKLNYQLASESLVLLKNNDNLLPLAIGDDDIAIIGPNAKLAAACGGGSASLRPYYTSSVFDGISKHVSRDKIHYEVGAYGHILLPIFGSSNVVDEDSLPGVTIHFYNEPHTVPERKSFDHMVTPDASYQLMDYTHPLAKDTFYMSMKMFFTPDQTGPYDFGLAVYGTADLFINDELVIDNSTHQVSGGMFFGRGTTEKRTIYPLTAGVTYNLRVEAGSASTTKVDNPKAFDIPGGACRLGGCLSLDPTLAIQRAVDLAKKCKYTILVAGLNVSFLLMPRFPTYNLHRNLI